MEILSYAFVIVCSMIIPVVLSVLCIKKHHGYTKPLLLGMLTFFVFQILIRIPIIQLVLTQTMWYTKLTMSIIPYAIFMGLTAALFEEIGRYIVMRLFLKDRLSARHGIAFGIGHGGIEAFLLVGINFIAALFLGISIGSPMTIFLAGAERILTMIFHIGMSVMVIKSVREKKIIWLIVAVALHAILDAAAVIAVYYGVNSLLIELIILGFALYAFLFTRKELKYQ